MRRPLLAKFYFDEINCKNNFAGAIDLGEINNYALGNRYLLSGWFYKSFLDTWACGYGFKGVIGPLEAYEKQENTLVLLIRNYVRALSHRRVRILQDVNVVIHLHDDEIEDRFVRSQTALIVMLHTGSNLEEFLDFLKEHLSEPEWQRFQHLWANDSEKRTFETKKGYLVIF